MQAKTIRKNIEKKITEWLDSIEDKGLSEKLKNNLLVSGGSIASMFLNEKVNDYDVYIKDMDILKQLVIYYVKPFTKDPLDSDSEIFVMDGRKKSTYMEEYGGEFDSDDNSYTVSIRNLKEDQIKIHLNVDKGGKSVNKEASEEDKLKYIPVFFSPNAISLSNGIQIVIRFHGDSTAIHKSFDFIHATNYFTFEEGLVTNKEALESLLTKQLKYQGSLYPLTSIIRTRKFIKRGWNITAGELLKIMFQIGELDLKQPDVLEEQLIGVDVAYFGTLIEILRGVDPAKFNSGYLNTIIDTVFEGFENED